MRHVSVGDPLAIPAPTWNQLLTLLEESQGAGPGRFKGFRQQVECLVRNDTGADLPQYGVVGFGAPLMLPGTDQDEFLKRVAFSGVLATSPAYDLKFGLTIAPIKSTDIGTVVVQGLCFCLIDTDGAVTAKPTTAGNVTALTSDTCGLARVLWRDSGAGNKWAIVCLG